MMVFLSHSTKDCAGFVRQLAAALEDRGYTTWYCERDVAQGEDEAAAIDAAIASSSCVLCILTYAALDSPDQMLAELDAASRRYKRLFAISLTDRPLPPEMASHLHTDIVRWNMQSPETSISFLIQELGTVGANSSFCPRCGSRVSKESLFCGFCGFRLETAQPKPGAQHSQRSSAHALYDSAPYSAQYQSASASSPRPSSSMAAPTTSTMSYAAPSAATTHRKKRGAFDRLRGFFSGQRGEPSRPREDTAQPPATMPPQPNVAPSPAPYVQPQQSPQADAPAPRLSDVSFSAVAPQGLVPGRYAIIDVVMFEEGWEAVVNDIAAQHQESVNTTTSGWTKVSEGTCVRVELACNELGLLDSQEQMWSGRYLRFGFPFMVPEGLPHNQVLFVASVSFDGIPATRLSFLAAVNSAQSQELGLTRNDIHTAFVSYASADRSRVATIVQGMKAVRPDLDLFFDVESLRSGENWEHVLMAEISKRDLLFLCWSQNARTSRWVDFEWRYALEQHGISSIEPVPIDPPDVCPPPAELSSKHFSDRLLYVINYPGH